MCAAVSSNALFRAKGERLAIGGYVGVLRAAESLEHGLRRINARFPMRILMFQLRGFYFRALGI